MVITLYGADSSGPVRAVKMAIKALNLEVEERPVNTLARENYKPEYLKMNPLHTIPTLDDDGFIVYDSHAIIFYLTNKYNKDLSLYPNDIKKRTIIEQRLHFDTGYLFTRAVVALKPVFYEGRKKIPKEHLESIEECYGFLETFLECSSWIAGDFMSIADISITSTVTSLDIIAPVDAKKYPKLTAWLDKMKQQPFYKENITGLNDLRDVITSRIN